MTLLEQIQKEIKLLPPEKQSEALDFILFLQKQSTKPRRKVSLRKHPAYGSWRGRKINALNYQQDVRSEWDHRP
jgi:mRNA-degrading endonuclease RelE of RelBE toxin-antitoxin system